MPGPGHQDRLAVDAVVLGSQHLLSEVDRAVAGRLGPDEAAAPLDALAGENPGELVRQLLVLAEQEADLTSANTDVPGRDIGARADVSVELAHEGLAEAHDLAVALALGVEVRSALASAQGKGREGVLVDLLEGEELQDAEIDRRVEAQTALVWADCAVHLDAIAAVHLNRSFIIDPGDPEDDDPLGLHHAVEDLRLQVLRVSFEQRPDRLDDFASRLMELELGRGPLDQMIHEPGDGLLLHLTRPFVV